MHRLVKQVLGHDDAGHDRHAAERVGRPGDLRTQPRRPLRERRTGYAAADHAWRGLCGAHRAGGRRSAGRRKRGQAALALAAERGGTGATATLHALADSIQDRLKAQREIETERAKPRIVVRQVTVVTVLALAAALLFGREFFAPYSTPTGQIILVSLLALYVASLLMLRRMTMPRRRDRILRSLR